MDPRLSAERAFQAGKRLLDGDSLELAHGEFKRAAELLDGLAEYRLYVQWLEWLRGNTTPVHVAALRATSEEAIVEDPNLAFPRYVLGRLALTEGDVHQAKPLLQFATKLDVTLLDAKRYVSLIELREGHAGGPALPKLTIKMPPPVPLPEVPPPPSPPRVAPPRSRGRFVLVVVGLTAVMGALIAVLTPRAHIERPPPSASSSPSARASSSAW